MSIEEGALFGKSMPLSLSNGSSTLLISGKSILRALIKGISLNNEGKYYKIADK